MRCSLWSFLVLGTLLWLAAPGLTAELTPSISATDVDWAQCQAFEDGRALGTAPREALEALLGLRAVTDKASWSTGQVVSMRRSFRVAFTGAVEIGTLCTTYSGEGSVYWFGVSRDQTVSYLKPDAPYPGDVTVEAQWLPLPSGLVKTLPPGTRTRALRFTEHFPSAVATPSAGYVTPASEMGVALLFKERYYPATNLGAVTERWEGRGQARAAHELTGYWNTPQTLVGLLALSSRETEVTVAYLKPGVTAHPLAAAKEDWKFATRDAGASYPQVFAMPPAPTRGLRVLPVHPVGPISYALGGPVLLLAKLGEEAQPPTLRVPPAPYTIPYTMPLQGFIALNVLEKKTGKIIRRVIAETARDKGAVAEPWDLQDEAKQFVPPGDYEWTAVACPPLTLTYQTTVNNAGHPPWWAPVRGGGGWLADESPPASVCALGKQTLLIGSLVCEKGQVGVATDLDGNKLWGESPVLTGWGGGDRLASDGRYGYLINHYGIERVDPEVANFNPTEVLKFAFTREVPGGAQWGEDLGGAAVRGDKLYVAFHAPPVPWITPAPLAEDFALLQCLPLVRKTHEYPEGNYDDITRFLSAFQLQSPNDRSESSFGDAPTAGALSGTLTVAFNKPIIVGSVLVPNARYKVYALKPGKQLTEDSAGAPDNPDAGAAGGDDAEDKFSEELWEPLSVTGKNGQPALALAKAGGIVTRALRYAAPRLEYCLVMNHRLRDVAPEAARVYGEGEATEHGGWAVQRPARPLLTVNNPARMALVWKAPVALRGVSFHLPTTASMAVDCWIGPADGDPGAKLADDACWKSLGQIEIEIDRYWARTASVRNMDFAGEVTTRALRFRAVLAAGVLGVQGFRTPVTKTQYAGFDAMLAYSALGEDNADIPKPLNERISEYQLPPQGQGKLTLVRHLPLAKPGYLAVGKDGALLAVSDGRVVAAPLDGDAAPREVVAKTSLDAPAGIAVDADGLLYVVDQGPSVVKVFDPATGKLLRTIGTPGGFKLGPWDPTRFDTPVDLAIDGNGKLWVAESSIQPKRVSRWTRDGQLEKYFLGPTNYGGGGSMGGGAWMDPHDRAVVNFDGMKFTVNWQDYSWKLDSILYRPGVNGPEHSPTPNRVVYVQGRRYLLGDPRVYSNIAVICVEKNGVATPVAAAGTLGSWDGLDRYPGFKEAFADLSREGCGFVWTDTHGDGIPRVADVQVTTKTPLKTTYCASCVGEDLSFNFDGERLRPTGFTATGAPTYDLAQLQKVPELSGEATWTTEDGSSFVIGNKMLSPEGAPLWEIHDPAPGVNRSGAPRLPGVPVAQFEVMGRVKIAGEDLFVTNGNYGDWFLTTRDGLMPIWILGGPPGYGRAHWTMPECIPGKTKLVDVRMDAEDFCGTITRADDGQVYLIAGGNHNSIVRVDGLEGMQRLHGSLTVTKEDLEKARAWQVQKAAVENALQEPKIDAVSYMENEDIAIDGSLDEWAPFPFMTVHQHHDELKGDVPDTQIALAYNGDNLYVGARCDVKGEMMNSAGNIHNLFKGGDAVDICLGLDPKSNPARSQPVAGDLRLLIARQADEHMVAVLYRPVVPGTPLDARTRYLTTAGGEVFIDVVQVIEGAEIAVKTDKRSWTLEARLPWKSMGVTAPTVDSRLRGDVGILLADQNGMHTVDRWYWSGKSQTTVSDEPTEARLTPGLWGELDFVDTTRDKAPTAMPGEGD